MTEKNTYGVAKLTSSHNHLHLEDVALGHAGGHQALEHLLLVEAEGAGEVRGARPQQHLGHIVGAPRDHLPLQVPPVHTWAQIFQQEIPEREGFDLSNDQCCAYGSGTFF